MLEAILKRTLTGAKQGAKSQNRDFICSVLATLDPYILCGVNALSTESIVFEKKKKNRNSRQI